MVGLVQIVLALGLAGLAYVVLDPARWYTVVPEAMVCMSILAAALLFRLGRGFPQFPVEELSLDRVKPLTRAYREVAFRLALMLGLTALAILSLAVTRLALTDGSSGLASWPFCRELMATSVFFTALAVTRSIALVKGDVDLVRLQASLKEEQIQLLRGREAADRLDESKRVRPFKNPKTYGGLASYGDQSKAE